MEADGSRFIISNEKELIIALAVCAVLTAIRLFYGCAEAAADELRRLNDRRYEDSRIAELVTVIEQETAALKE